MKVERGTTYKKHPNGGGYVSTKAFCAENVYVGPGALVGDEAFISGAVRIEDSAVVEGSANITGPAEGAGVLVIKDDARVGGWAWVKGEVTIRGDAKVRDCAAVSGKVDLGSKTAVGGRAYVVGMERGFRIQGVRVDISDSAFVVGNGAEIPRFADMSIKGDKRMGEGAGSYKRTTRNLHAPKGYTRHLNGGGLVSNLATVEQGAYVGAAARVEAFAYVEAGAKIFGKTQIKSRSYITSKSSVSAKSFQGYSGTSADWASKGHLEGKNRWLGKAKDWRDKTFPKGYHRHSNGGGLVADTAHVAETAFVGVNAEVRGYASVLNNTRILDNAQVYGHAQVGEQAIVQGSAAVYDDAIVTDSAVVKGKAHVRDGATVGGDAVLSGNAKVHGQVVVEGGVHHNKELGPVDTAVEKSRESLDAEKAFAKKVHEGFAKLAVAHKPPTTPEGFHRHPRGGGLVSDTAYVCSESYVGVDAKVLNGACVVQSYVTDAARVEDSARIFHSHLSGKARAFGASFCKDVKLSGRALVRDNARVERSVIGGVSKVDQDAHVYDSQLANCNVSGLVEDSSIADRDVTQAQEVRNETPVATEAVEEGFRRHDNGGGLVALSANVEASVYVGPKARVLGKATVTGSSELRNHAIVSGGATVSDTRLEEYAQITDEAVVSSSQVYDGCVSGSSVVAGSSVWGQVQGSSFVKDSMVEVQNVVKDSKLLSSDLSSKVHIESSQVSDSQLSNVTVRQSVVLDSSLEDSTVEQSKVLDATLSQVAAVKSTVIRGTFKDTTFYERNRVEGKGEETQPENDEETSPEEDELDVEGAPTALETAAGAALSTVMERVGDALLGTPMLSMLSAAGRDLAVADKVEEMVKP